MWRLRGPPSPELFLTSASTPVTSIGGTVASARRRLFQSKLDDSEGVQRAAGTMLVPTEPNVVNLSAALNRADDRGGYALSPPRSVCRKRAAWLGLAVAAAAGRIIATTVNRCSC